jgi:hypothetical protein
MRRYQTDRFGMISSFDIAEALRRAERRRAEEELRRREREAAALEQRGIAARVRALFAAPRRSAA